MCLRRRKEAKLCWFHFSGYVNATEFCNLHRKRLRRHMDLNVAFAHQDLLCQCILFCEQHKSHRHSMKLRRAWQGTCAAVLDTVQSWMHFVCLPRMNLPCIRMRPYTQQLVGCCPQAVLIRKGGWLEYVPQRAIPVIVESLQSCNQRMDMWSTSLRKKLARKLQQATGASRLTIMGRTILHPKKQSPSFPRSWSHGRLALWF